MSNVKIIIRKNFINQNLLKIMTYHTKEQINFNKRLINIICKNTVWITLSNKI